MLNVLRLTGTLDISQASELRQQLLLRLKSDPESLIINLEAVTGVDTSIVQLLVALKVQEPKTKIVDCSEAVVEQFDRMGLMRLLV
jgi:anti-anti-sigma regulatory factor